MQAANGVQYVRTHIDINDPNLTALEAILELREEVRDYMDIQIVAFPQYGILSYPNGAGLLEQALKMGADAAGAIPHFEFTREYSVESLNICFELAQKYDKLIDVHCDEIDDEASRGLETVATRAYETGMRDRVTASHTTAMHSYNNAYMIRLMRILKLSGMNFVANPCVNVHLGGRTDTYPKRRSMTRVKELTAEGINVSFGSDDIFDPWNPLGNSKMRDQVFMGLYTGHMLGYPEIVDSYQFVTTKAAHTLHLGDAYGIRPGNDANFVIMDAANWYDALNYDAPVLRNYRKGKLIASTAPVDTKVFF
jgi:cytosine deaminase